MYEGKKSTDKWFPVVLLDDTDFKTAETGIAFGSVTCKYSYEGATSLSTYSVTTDDWKEAGEGKYWLSIGNGEFTSNGKYEVSVAASGCLTYNFCVEVKDYTDQEQVTYIVGFNNKMPTNNIMGSSDHDNHDTDVDNIETILQNTTYGCSALRTQLDLKLETIDYKDSYNINVTDSATIEGEKKVTEYEKGTGANKKTVAVGYDSDGLISSETPS